MQVRTRFRTKDVGFKTKTRPVNRTLKPGAAMKCRPWTWNSEPLQQSYHSTVKSAGVPVLWFCLSPCFRLWSITYAKCCVNSSLLHVTKKFVPCLFWSIICCQFQNMFWKNTVAFDWCMVWQTEECRVSKNIKLEIRR